MNNKELKLSIIEAGEKAVKQLVKVAKEDIIKFDKDDELAADRLKNAAATKKLCIMDAFEILKRIEEERALLEGGIIDHKQINQRDLQSQDQNKLYTPLKNVVPKAVLSNKNRAKSWIYGYDSKYDIIVISKTGEIENIIDINGLRIALPKAPKEIYKRSKKKEEQYWEAFDYPKELSRIKSIFQWHDVPDNFKGKWVDYIEGEFDKRDDGFWFMNNGEPTYVTGTHYMYLQWTKIDVGHPDFREANRIFYIFWEACKADKRSFGMCYLKIRRSGFSFMASNEGVNTATITKDARVGILSKTGSDAKKMFTDKVVPISNNYPFFFKPIQDGMDKPKTELAYRVPASKITKKNMYVLEDSELEGLDTTIDWKNTGDNSYDGEKLRLLLHDESGKWERPDNILNNWRVTKTCLRLGSKVIGKCMMGSTSNALDKGGNNFKNFTKILFRQKEILMVKQKAVFILCLFQWNGTLKDI